MWPTTPTRPCRLTKTSALSQAVHVTAVTSVMVLDSVTHMLTLRFHGLESMEWTTTSANQLGSTSSCRADSLQRFMCVTVWINFLSPHSTFCVQVKFVLIVQNVAMSGKVKAIRHKVQCLLCSEVSECVNFTSMSEIPTR